MRAVEFEACGMGRSCDVPAHLLVGGYCVCVCPRVSFECVGANGSCQRQDFVKRHRGSVGGRLYTVWSGARDRGATQEPPRVCPCVEPQCLQK